MRFGWPRLTLDVVGSTMDTASTLAARGAREGTVVVARHQSAGRGRAGRHWETPPGAALLCSVVLRPGLALSALSPMSVLAGDAIASAIHRLTGLEARVKWPNDVLIDDRKVAGVLIQTRSGSSGTVMVVGFGVNVTVPPDALPVGATSLIREGAYPVSHDVLLDAILDGIGERYRDVQAGNTATSLERIGRSLAMRGERVIVRDGTGERSGVVAGVDADGALLLDDGGIRQRVVVGDVVRGPRRSRAQPG